jgi:hypothetical protein
VMLGFLRDGAYAFRLATLVRDDLSSSSSPH